MYDSEGAGTFSIHYRYLFVNDVYKIRKVFQALQVIS